MGDKLLSVTPCNVQSRLVPVSIGNFDSFTFLRPVESNSFCLATELPSMSDRSLLLTEADLARTYDGGVYADAVEVVEQYHEVMRYRSKHPDKGSLAIATRFDLPRGRVRPWVDRVSKPDPVRAIDAARRNGWIDVGYQDKTFSSLNALVANVFSGGSVAEEGFQPSFALNRSGSNDRLFDALEAANVSYQVVDERERRADEVRPTENGTVLGRVLSALGAPVGPKARQRLGLPGYLDDAPSEIRETFVRCYLENRASEREGRKALTFREDRNVSYLHELAALIEDISDGSVNVNGKNVYVTSEAAANLERTTLSSRG